MDEHIQLGELSNIIERLDQTVEALTKEVRQLRASDASQPGIPERLSGSKVADLFGVKPSTIRKNWANYGLVRVGRASHGAYLFSKDSVLRHLREREAGNF